MDYYSGTATDQRTLVTINKSPTAKLSFPGANCLLCIGAAIFTNAPLSKHVKTLSTSSLEDLSAKVAAGLGQKNLNAQHTIYKNDFKELRNFPDFSKKSTFAKKDFRPLKEKLKTDHLVLLTILDAGVRKPYVEYIPIGEPVAFLHVNVKIIDLTSNELIVNRSIYSAVPADGEWMEPPFYPGLTTAFHQAISNTEDIIGKTLSIKL